jgi:heptosyltransferase I
MAERILLVRLGSLGDIIFTLPTAAALRDSFPDARIDWLTDARWRPLLDGNLDLNEVVALSDRNVGTFLSCGHAIRARKYSIAIDIQALYKSAIFARISGAPRRIGFTRDFVRERGAEWLYTERVAPLEPHMVEQNLALAWVAGAKRAAPRFPLQISQAASNAVSKKLAGLGAKDFGVLSLGGGWLSKCWPATRFGELALQLFEHHGLRFLINCGPGESQMAREAVAAAGAATPQIVEATLAELMALLRVASIAVAADSGPLHLAVALGTPVVGLYGPTSPARNGPYNPSDIVVRNASSADTTYKRRNAYSGAMLSITVEQVVDAVERRLGLKRALAIDVRTAS